jgi:hypothetical protein
MLVTIPTEERAGKCCKLLAAHHLELLVNGLLSVRKTTAVYLELKKGGPAVVRRTAAQVLCVL